MVAAEHGPGLAELLVEQAGRAAWSWRWELVATLPPAALGATGWLAAGAVGGAAGALAGTGASVLASRRPAARRVLRDSRLRREWTLAVGRSGVEAFAAATPRILRSERTGGGDVLTVAVPRGTTVTELERATEALAAVLEAREVRVLRDPANARRASVTILRDDPLAVGPPPAWPRLDASQLSVWEPIPVGIDEDGWLVNVSLPERNLLLGGEPGAGKSSALALLVATAALDPSCRLWLLDGKLVELAVWRGCADGAAGVEAAEAIDVLRSLRSTMDRRYAELLHTGRRKVAREDSHVLHLVVIDELAHYLTWPDRKQRTDLTDLLRDLVSRGRAAGVIVLAATQKPSTDIVPSSLRDLFGFRWALRCATAQASDTILGSGWATAGYSAATVDAACRGVGYLLHEGGRPARLRAYYLEDAHIAAIAARAVALRRSTSGATP